MRTLTTAAGAVAAAGALAAAGAHVWARHVEIHRYVLREERLEILPPGTRPVRLLHISDIHLMPDQERKLQFLRRLAALKPHLVIDTGDNISSAASVAPLAEALDPLLRRPGAYVWGSNDLYAPHPKNPLRYFKRDPRPENYRDMGPGDLPTAELGAALSCYGWKDLDNTRASIDLTGLRIEFAGVDDPHLERDEFPGPESGGAASVPSATGGSPAGGVGPTAGAVGSTAGADSPAARPVPTLRIGVAHAPYRRVLDAFVADGAQLILAGHTHGGQLRVPGIGALVTNCDLPRRQAKGLSDWDGVPLHVSGGMGSSPYANFRFANPPEATLLTLVPARG